MVLTALLGLALMGVIASWDRQLPEAGERFQDLSLKRRALTIAAIPVSILVIAAFAVAVLNAAAFDNQPGYGDQMFVFLLGGAALGFSYLLAIAVSRLWKARQADSAPEV